MVTFDLNRDVIDTLFVDGSYLIRELYHSMMASCDRAFHVRTLCQRKREFEQGLLKWCVRSRSSVVCSFFRFSHAVNISSYYFVVFERAKLMQCEGARTTTLPLTLRLCLDGPIHMRQHIHPSSRDKKKAECAKDCINRERITKLPPGRPPPHY